jgi:thiol-disulfide isomerase/thioredoxin
MGALSQVEAFLSENPHYRDIVESCLPDSGALEGIKDRLSGLNVKVFFGDWCPDCRAHMPTFLAAVLELGVDDYEVEFIEMNRQMSDGLNKAAEHNVMAIPTFIFFRGELEIGRIIERPKESMEKDMAEILGGS